MKKLQLLFMIIVVFSAILLGYSLYKSYIFKKNDLDIKIVNQLKQKENEILYKIKRNFNINFKVPIIISKKMPNNLYGLATMDKKGNIYIYLNKKMFQESKDYMINNVLSHEYAHALMFKFNKFSQKKGGHTNKWISVCKQIGGVKCEQYVNRNDILLSKRDIFN